MPAGVPAQRRAAWRSHRRAGLAIDAAAALRGSIRSTWRPRRKAFRRGTHAAGGQTLVRVEPRVWNEGSWHFIDYEIAVADTFVPDLPSDVRTRHPLTVRFLGRKAPGALSQMQLAYPTGSRMRLDLRISELIEPELLAVGRENALLLTCSYNGEKGTVREDYYWFEKIPAHVSEGRLNKALSPHPFNSIQGAASKCPAKRPPG
jgi:hypothetical protein